MKKMLLLAGVLLLLSAPVAMAKGVNLTWGKFCYSDAPAATQTFACNTNSGITAGPWFMTTSFMIDTDMPDMVGIEQMLEGMSDDPALPDWWKVGAAPDCRAGKSLYNSKIGSSASDVCLDWTANAGFDVYNYIWDTNRAHISALTAIDASTPFDILPNTEYLGGQIEIDNSKTVGTGSCAGCSSGMIWGLYSIVVASLPPPGTNRRDECTEPIPGGNQCITWNNSALPCADPVPARATTWGQVKSLYR